LLAFKDIEDSIGTFDGKHGKAIEPSIGDFEDTGATFLKEVQFLYEIVPRCTITRK